MRIFFLLIFTLFFSIGVFAQPYFRWNDSIPVKINGNTLTNAWAGGLNFIQASNIDLNLDGITDLFVFDRTGNKVRTFINNGTPNTVDFKYAPQYETLFPDLHDWALLVDYNCDGKEDIFTYSNGGLAIYKNTATITDGLQFELATPLQYSYYNPPGGQYSPLYITPVDVPSLSDIDNDGDIDVVTFTNSSSYIQYHQNKSMELYGTCDSLVFEVKNRCWGYVSESSFSNNYTLHDTCVGNISNPGISTTDNDSREMMHQGGCSLCIDLDGDNDKEFITGDVSYNNLTMFTNGGTPTAGNFIAKDVAFPLNNGGTAINLPVFPCAYSVDVNSDSLKDLLVSPNSPGVSKNYNSLVYYKNTGTSAFPVFQFQQTNFLQDNMIDVSEGAYPVFFDYNNDGLKDLFAGNYGYYTTSGFGFQTKIAVFKNIGTSTNPVFELVNSDYANLSTLGINNMIPAFGDMDADGDEDMIIGGYDGKLHYFENTATAGDSANFVLTQTNFKNANNRSIDVGDFAAPQIADVDGDQKNDLVIGGRNGQLAYYHHSGNANAAIPAMDSVSHFWGNIKVNRPGYFVGYSHPFVFKQNGVTNLIVGEESGYLRFYNGIDSNINGAFTLADSAFEHIYQGTRTAPCGTDINNDGLLDLVVGNYQGGLSFYKGNANSLTSISTEPCKPNWNFNVFPNPSNTSVTIKINADKTGTYKIELYSILGQLVASEKTQNNLIRIETSNIQQGIYSCKIIELTAEQLVKSIQIKKLVIQH